MSFKIKHFLLGMVRTNCYIVYNDKNEAVIIDPADLPDKIAAFIDDNNLNPLAILLTHGHFDHVGGACYLRDRYNIKIYADEHEKIVLNNRDYNLSSDFGMDISFDADVYIKDGDVLKLGDLIFKTVYTPGHTIGSTCYILEDVVFSGDTLFAGTHGRTDFPTGSEGMIMRSIKDKLLKLDENMTVYPGHDIETTIYEEKGYY